MGFSIICDARCGGKLGITTLALVDRSKSKRSWWTSDRADLVLNYRKESAAKFACGRLIKNNARVVSYSDAIGIIKAQDSEITYHEASRGSEVGWDAHKIT